MSTSDILLLSQTVVLAVTAAILIWYTVETYKIRKATSEQNAMMAEQLLIMQKNYEFEIEKQISYVDPIFDDEGGNEGADWLTRRVVNKGATIKNVSIFPKGEFNIKIEPFDVIHKEKSALIRFQGLPSPQPEKLYFEIQYENMIGRRRKKDFVYLKAHKKVMEYHKN